MDYLPLPGRGPFVSEDSLVQYWFRARRLNLRRPRTAGADNERFQRPNALASSEMMATVYSRILVLAAICPYALAFTGVPPSAMSSSYAHASCHYNMQMPRRVVRPSSSQAQEAGFADSARRPARAAIMPLSMLAPSTGVLAQAATKNSL